MDFDHFGRCFGHFDLGCDGYRDFGLGCNDYRVADCIDHVVDIVDHEGRTAVDRDIVDHAVDVVNGVG